MKWTFSVNKPNEIVSYECGVKNKTTQVLLALIHLRLANGIPELVVTSSPPDGYLGRIVVQNDSMVILNIQPEDTGNYGCILKTYNRGDFRTLTVSSPDTYLFVIGMLA